MLSFFYFLFLQLPCKLSALWLYLGIKVALMWTSCFFDITERAPPVPAAFTATINPKNHWVCLPNVARPNWKQWLHWHLGWALVCTLQKSAFPSFAAQKKWCWWLICPFFYSLHLIRNGNQKGFFWISWSHAEAIWCGCPFHRHEDSAFSYVIAATVYILSAELHSIPTQCSPPWALVCSCAQFYSA